MEKVCSIVAVQTMQGLQHQLQFGEAAMFLVLLFRFKQVSNIFSVELTLFEGGLYRGEREWKNHKTFAQYR